MILMAGLVSVLGFVGLGCGGQDEAAESEPLAEVTPNVERPKYKVPPTVPGMPAKVSEQSRTIQEELKVKQEIPDYYPEDAPVYPGSLPSNIRTQGSTVTLAFGTNDSADQVVEFMQSDLNSNGWTVLPEQELPNGTLIQGTKDGRMMSVLVAGLEPEPEGESTIMMVSVQR
jgi:hypothetical protein